MNPLIIGLGLLAIPMAIKAWTSRASAQWSTEMPKGVRYKVQLKNGDITDMTAAQLKQAIESRAVKSYQRLK